MSPASLSANPRYQLLSDQILAARGEDIVIDIGGPERLRTTADSIVPEAACTSTQLHVQVAPGAVRGVLERLPGDRRRPARGRRQLAVPARQGAVARDPDPAVRAGHRHPQRGAEGAGRAAAGVVRRALDQLDLRPVRGERPLLPGAAADHRRRGPARGARGRAARPRSPSCGCTTARSTAGTGRSTTSSTACRTCGSRTACCRPGRPSPTRWPTPPSTSAWSARSPSSERPLWSQMSFQRRRGELPRRRRSTASTPASTGRASGRCRPPSWCCAGCCRWRAPGSTRGASPADEATGCSASSSSAASPGSNGASWFVDRMHRPADDGDDRLRRAARDPAGVPRADAHQRARAHLGRDRSAAVSGGQRWAASTPGHRGAGPDQRVGTRRQVRPRRCSGRASRSCVTTCTAGSPTPCRPKAVRAAANHARSASPTHSATTAGQPDAGPLVDAAVERPGQRRRHAAPRRTTGRPAA